MSESLSSSQRAHWERYLEDSERAVELAKKVLGIVAVEETVEVQEDVSN